MHGVHGPRWFGSGLSHDEHRPLSRLAKLTPMVVVTYAHPVGARAGGNVQDSKNIF